MAKPIRILHMIGSLNVGGSQAMVINLLEAIDRTKVQFDFVVDSPDEKEWASRVEALGARIYTMPKFSGGNLFQVKKAWDTFFTEHPEYRIIHSHVRSYASLYLPIAKKHGVKTIIHSHSTSNGSGITAVVKRVLQLPLRFQADYFFGCSKEAGQWLFGKKVIESSKYHIIKNAIDIKKYKVDPEIRRQYRDAFNLGQKKTFVHIGRFHPAKNHMFLMEVFAKIVERDPNSVLLLVGDGELRSELKKKTYALGLENEVKFLGKRDDVPQILQAADCFLFPSLWEGVPVTVIEAQAAGIPCLISDRITKEVAVSSIVHCLPVDEGVECWTQLVRKITNTRMDVTKELQEHGYDIDCSALCLTNFYENLALH